MHNQSMRNKQRWDMAHTHASWMIMKSDTQANLSQFAIIGFILKLLRCEFDVFIAQL